MRKYLCLLPLLLWGFAAQAQGNALAAFNQQQTQTLKTGMLVLGGWAILNIVIGSFKLTKASRSKKFYFQMNLYWNIVNLCIAAAALYSLFVPAAASQTLAHSLYQHEWYKKILYLNVGLDIAYILLGAYLKERARNSPKTEQLLGWGQAIVLQGWFLLLLDGFLVLLLESGADQLLRLVPPL
ncbi:DUF6992 family protein [Pontibacter liquoris]|uniref:DUF6992 family protein n=1 Tax=Pontibacter liquoris TaxID=2905677 RepID=UPI001FA7847F|nr:hypothetical protein [Pontibacter liquoris]